MPSAYEGVAIEARGVSRVTLRNVNAKGWETGLSVADGAEWTIEGCDFSDNFHDPAFGWGENGRRGGIVLERVSRSVVRKNRANRVWDACVLVECDDNTIEENQCVANEVAGILLDSQIIHAAAEGPLEVGSDHNRIARNWCPANHYGIAVAVGSDGNELRENIALASAGFDCASGEAPTITTPKNRYSGTGSNRNGKVNAGARSACIN